MPKVKCTRPWWHKRTYYKTGSVVEVPEGSSIPAGFIVDGKPTPMKSGRPVKIQMAESENQALKARIAELEAAVAKLSENSQPPEAKKSGKKE